MPTVTSFTAKCRFSKQSIDFFLFLLDGEEDDIEEGMRMLYGARNSHVNIKD